MEGFLFPLITLLLYFKRTSMKYIFLIIIFSAQIFSAQILNKRSIGNSQDSLIVDKGKKDSLKIFKPTINDYLIQNQFSDKKVFDTVFTVDKSYMFTQFNNKDNFGKIQFSNIRSMIFYSVSF